MYQFHAAAAELSTAVGAINTVILIGSGLPMHLAHKAAERGDRRTLTPAGLFAVSKLPSGSEIPAWATAAPPRART